MTFEQYWHSLVDRAERKRETLAGAEATFFRLSCIYGECMVDGIQAYFDRRYADYDADMEALQAHGFNDLVQGFHESRTILFGEKTLSAEICDESKIPPEMEPTIDIIY